MRKSSSPSLNFFEVQRSNERKTWVLFFFFFLLVLILTAGICFYLQEFIITPIIILVLSAIYAFFAYTHSSFFILSLFQATSAQSHPKYKQLSNIVEELSVACGIQPPKIVIVHSVALNAFASGTDPQNSVVGVTTGLLDTLDRDELSGVIAHELAHIVQKDTKVMVLSILFVGIIGMLSDFFLRMTVYGSSSDRRDKGQLQLFLIIFAIVLAILAPVLAQLIRLAISRKREYLADATAVQLTRYPAGLASALEKIKKGSTLDVGDTVAQLCIHNNTGHWFSGLFSTHPPIEKRIDALKRM
jgi:heat shock protein HtpX